MKNKVLIIEDDAFLASVLAKKCISSEYETEVSLDGKEGFEKIKSWKPGIILLDIILPNMNGFDILKEKQANPEIANIPVIIITNSDNQIDSKQLETLGVKKLMPKADFDPSDIVKEITKIFSEVNEVKIEKPINEMKILWVEDDKFLNELISRKIKDLGSQVVSVETGELALSLVKSEKPNLVILDVVLPGISGIEVLEKVKADKETAAIPVIMLSNFDQDENVKKCLALGAEKYLVKASLTLEGIIDEVRKILLKK